MSCGCTDCSKMETCPATVIDALLEDNARLREALRRIARYAEFMPLEPEHEIARAALGAE